MMTSYLVQLNQNPLVPIPGQTDQFVNPSMLSTQRVELLEKAKQIHMVGEMVNCIGYGVCGLLIAVFMLYVWKRSNESQEARAK